MVAGFVACIFGFSESALAPPIIPNMKPIMNPPPMITLGTENTIIIIPHTFLFAGFRLSIRVPSNTRTPQIEPTVASSSSNVGSLPVEPGRIGMIPIDHLATIPRATALINIKIPADKVKVFVDFSLTSLFIFILPAAIIYY